MDDKKNYRDREVTRELAFALTEADFAQKGKQSGRLRADLSLLEYEKEVESKAMKRKIEAKEQELSDVLAVIHQGHENREVRCVERFEYELGVVQYLFDGKVMETRAMHPNERQLTMDNVVTMPEKTSPPPKN